MKVKLIISAFFCLLIGVAAVNVHLSLKSENPLSGLALANMNALAYAEGSNPGGVGMNPFEGVGGSIASTKEECFQKNGYWNELLDCADGGVTTQTCTITGQITLFGVTIQGSYTKGNAYTLVWARYACRQSDGNCCNGNAQGIYVK